MFIFVPNQRTSRYLALFLLLGLVLSSLPGRAEVGRWSPGSGRASFEGNTAQGPALGNAIAVGLLAPSDSAAVDAPGPWKADPSPTQPDQPSLVSAFTDDVALASGERLLTISPSPLRYQAEDGSWQPIDARFTAVEGGFLNSTNLLRISAGDRTAVLRLQYGAAVGWEPQALVLRTSQGAELGLASVLEREAAAPAELSKQGGAIHYPASWSLPGLEERVSASPGQVEQSLLVNSPFPSQESMGEGTILVLRASLHLFPGVRLYADGTAQPGAFATTGAIEIRDASGSNTLLLEPAVAFEQGNPRARVAGRYRLTPQGEGQWQVAVETPWEWWSDPGRVYPVVLDPTMKVKSPLTAAVIHSNWPNPCSFTGYTLPSGAPAGVMGGEESCGELRTLVRFDQLPNLPPGYVIEKAELLVAPESGYAKNVEYVNTGGSNGPVPMATMNTSVWEITSPWDPTVTWGSQPSTGSQVGNGNLVYTDKAPLPGYPYVVTRINLQTGPTGIVTNWLLGGANYGLELSGEECGYGNNQYFCEAVVVPLAPNWKDTDLQKLDQLYTDPPGEYAAGGGFMLFITYTAPTLALGEPLVHDVLPTFDKNMAHTHHAYRLPASGSTWTAVGVKGLDQTTYGGDNTLLDPAGYLRLQSYKNCPGSGYLIQPSEGDLALKPNYFLVRGNPADCAVEAWVDPPNPTTPANANLDHYAVQALPSGDLPGNPVFVPYTHITTTLTMSTSDVLMLLNLNLQANTRVGVRVSATTVVSGTGWTLEVPYLEARVFDPVGANSILVKEFNGEMVGGYVSETPYGMGAFDVGSANGGAWALALDYSGPVKPVFDDPPYTSTVPLNLFLEVEVLACPLDAVPTDGGCVLVHQPDDLTDYVDVPPFRVFSPAGFDCNGSACQTRPASQTSAAPSIYWIADWNAGQRDRAVVVADKPVSVNAPVLYLATLGQTRLVQFQSSTPLHMLQILQKGYSAGVTNPADPDYGRLRPDAGALFAGLPLIGADAAGAQMNINVDTQAAEARSPLHRDVLTTPGQPLQALNFTLGWYVQAEGYALSLGGISIVPVSVPAQAEVASLTLLFGSQWTMDFRSPADGGFKPNGRFTDLRNLPGVANDGGAGAKIVNPPSLGGAWQGVTAILLPIGWNLPGVDAPCEGDCLDLRATNDSPSSPNRSWLMPDVTVTGLARSIAFNSPGQLVVYSADHPEAGEAVDVPFSFRTFEGQVTVGRQLCPQGGSNQIVTVITGKAGISLPGLGSDTNPANMISAEFVLCEAALRQVSLSFDAPPLPEIPVGSTGILVNHVKGKVTIGPNNTQIVIEELNYHDVSNNVVGNAKVTINTAGLLDLQTKGEVLKAVTYDGHAWVAWNPLDVGIDVHADYSWWLEGQVYAHLWKGQGWQHKYSWLPDDSQTHLAGSIAANIVIEKGEAFSWWWIDIPPFDLSIGITVAFGQFCAKGGCSSFEWGFKGKFTVVGYDVGFFYGFKSGFDFILGSDNHALIDQYGSMTPAGQALVEAGMVSADPLVGGDPTSFQHRIVADPTAPTVIEPFTVTSYAGSFVAGLAWVQGAPDLALIRPDGVEINPANAGAYGVEVSDALTRTLYGVPSPLPGVWQVKITNAAADNDYHFIYLANKAIPDVDLLTPVGNVTLPANNASYTIQWSVPGDPPPGVDLRISLYYTATNTTAPTDTQTYGGVIRENLPLTDGSYSWDLSSLAYGNYQVYARVYSGQPGNEPFQPAPTVTGTGQLPGDLVAVAPGVIQLHDALPPAVPTGLLLVPIQEGFWACWSHNTEKDLSGYVLRYLSPDVHGTLVEHSLRVNAEVVEPNFWLQCARLGRFNSSELIVAQIAAYDASGNLSAFSDRVSDTARGDPPAGVPVVNNLTATISAPGQVYLQWDRLSLPPGGGFWVHWARRAPVGLGQAEAPLPVDTNSATLNLQTGSVYYFLVQAHDDWARLGLPSNRAHLLVSDRVDGDADGLPDDWEVEYGVDSPDQDPDRDGLANQEELAQLTDPRDADTDGDWFSDGLEVAGASDPLDGSQTPATAGSLDLLPPPRLSLSATHLVFRNYTREPNPRARQVSILNAGGGTLNPTISDDAPWLNTVLNGSSLEVQVDQAGLPGGFYRGTITVAADGGYALDSPQQIVVDLWLFEGTPPVGYRVFLPLVVRRR